MGNLEQGITLNELKEKKQWKRSRILKKKKKNEDKKISPRESYRYHVMSKI